MWYTEAEILFDVKYALNPYEQVGILAQLNDVKRTDIEKILKRNGVPLPKVQRKAAFCARMGRPLKDIDRAEKRRAEKRRYYQAHRERLIEQAKINQKKRMERLRNGKKQDAAVS